jgi:hypothetical protein
MIRDSYLFSTVYSELQEFVPRNESIYFYGSSPEERSDSVQYLISRHSGEVNFVKIDELSKDIIREVKSGSEYQLRSSESIQAFLSKYNFKTLYLDSTGLSNRVCASFLNNAFRLKLADIRVIYVEPETYDIVRFKSESIFHDLSEKIDGIEPLPGFATIIPQDDLNIPLVALLGFEGGRFTYVLEHIQPSKDIYPVIGVPGFRPEFPFIAYWGNKRSLEDSHTWTNVKYVAANSLVEVYDLLTKLKKNQTGKLKVAPIGTKPHAIGAILFAIKNPNDVELIYDNPNRKIKRTKGVGKIIECPVSTLLASR